MPPVRLERDGDVAELILDAPPLNLFDAGVLDALEDALGAVEAALPRALIVPAREFSSDWSSGSSGSRR